LCVFEDEPEQHESQVAVDRLRPWRVLERQRDRVLEIPTPGVILVERQVGGQPEVCATAIGEPHVRAVLAGPFGNPARRIVEPGVRIQRA
jgi:hypothetical protein